MTDGRFAPLAEDWSCDDCGEHIAATLQAYIYGPGSLAGRCLCVKCAIDPDTDGSGEVLKAWEACPGYSPEYAARDLSELVPVSVGGLPPKDHSTDGRGMVQDSSLTLMSRFK